jgi:hypothetical protein
MLKPLSPLMMKSFSRVVRVPAEVGVRLGVPDAAEWPGGWPWVYVSVYRVMFWDRAVGKLAVECDGEGVYERRSANDLAVLRFCAALRPDNPGEPGMSRRPEVCRPNVWL